MDHPRTVCSPLMRNLRLLGAAGSACLVLLLSGCGDGGDDEDTRAELVEDLTATLQRSGSFDQEQSACFAEIIVDEAGVDALKDVDLSADQTPLELQEPIASAAIRATDECGLEDPEEGAGADPGGEEP
jgi:hypothetical protein